MNKEIIKELTQDSDEEEWKLSQVLGNFLFMKKYINNINGLNFIQELPTIEWE